MEFGRVSSDHYAGYVVDDSDLEYSDCGEYSSEDEGCKTSRAGGKGGQWGAANLSSEDEFEKEMDSEALATLKLMVSPTAVAQAVKGHVTTGPTAASTKDDDGMAVVPRNVSTNARATGSRARQRRRSAEQRKTVRFSLEAKDSGPSGASSGPDASQAEDMEGEEPTSSAHEEYYDDIYFDSSGSEDEGGGAEGIRKVGKKVRKMTDDELFYDPKMDEEDERWMKRQRMNYLNTHQLEQKKKQVLSEQIDSLSSASTSSSSPQAPLASTSTTPTRQAVDTATPLPKSDAVLNCPACMTTLCLDSQRHDIYVNQYRAMFVVNCCILRDEVLKYFPKPEKKSRKRNRGRKQSEQKQMAAPGGEQKEGAELYHPVHCSQCNTEVAVYDKDEVFHFFNVLTSAPG